ncbi:type I toxin-antitoxin system Hok family toxin [Cronobacter sakazakii]|uniref:Hok/Gef family protein n=1 Tax=Cronobacter sakazakii TaxID=28141 RepID=UPI003872C554|nr:type I toxin-antitoxin system Hok family toxin [Cronobacter sakazakii]MCI0310132.1 type I toxin-antitoxin system Hok family toxin [Cronobacter sakazakii]MCI0321122.1 type I toxin-antitoxin system Hok family toxin [Cronobacter sakazakii]
MPIKSRYAFLSILALCITVLCFALIMRDRLCEFTIKEGNTGNPCLRTREVAFGWGSNPPSTGQEGGLACTHPNVF